MKSLNLSIIGIICIIATGVILPHAFSESIPTTVKSNETETLPHNGTQFDLKINDTFSQELGAFKIKLLNVTSDSRCPDTAYCIWQGQVTVLVGITQGNQYLGNFSLSTLTGHDQLVFGKYALLLVQVKPPALIGKEISASDYVITFEISNAKNNDNITIVNTQVQPSTIRVGDTFTINATLVNNSTNTITVKNGCGGPFSVLFDTHAKVEVKKVCNWMAIQIILKPGENVTGSSLASNLAYRAIEPGTANATVIFSYMVNNKTSNLSLDNNATSISKSFIYTVSNQSGQSIPVISSPHAQFKSGIAAKDVKCQLGLQLIIKAEDGNPACVKPYTATKLVELGWAKSPENAGVFVTLTEGQREGPLYVQKIFSDSIQGLAFREYPLATNIGNPITLHIGDSASNGCTVELTLVKISNDTATFLKKENFTRSCPICLSENTVIDTPSGPINIKELKAGMTILTQNSFGHKQTGTILKVGRTLVPPDHIMIHVVLIDKRELSVSPNHPTADGKFFGDLLAGDDLDGSKIKSVEKVPYNGTYTYDILPSGQTGFYFANGILVASTLK